MAKKIKDDKLDPYRRDITEYTPDWKESQAQLQDMLMRAKVQFINGDLLEQQRPTAQLKPNILIILRRRKCSKESL